jgi:hypothetical protein
MTKVDGNFLISKGFKHIGGTYIMPHPDDSLGEWIDEIEIILGDGDFDIWHYNNSHKELGWQDTIHNKLYEIENNTYMLIKTLEVL